MSVAKQIDLRQKDLDVLVRIFSKYPEIKEVRLFGSRAKGESGWAADIDLAIYTGPMSALRWSDCQEDIEESSIIYYLDVVRVDDELSPEFRNRIETEGVQIFPLSDSVIPAEQSPRA